MRFIAYVFKGKKLEGAEAPFFSHPYSPTSFVSSCQCYCYCFAHWHLPPPTSTLASTAHTLPLLSPLSSLLTASFIKPATRIGVL